MSGDRELLARHLPVLRYDSQGSFLAGSPGILSDRPSNLLRDADGKPRAGDPGGPRLNLAYLGWPHYADGTIAARPDYLDAVGRDYVMQARQMHRGEYANRIHGRAVRADDGGLWLQYWFFYLYNNKSFLGFGLHEGDWEMVQVRLGARGEPAAMAFAQHTHGQRLAWGEVERRGQRPVVYIARGSQASYASAGRHDAPVVPDYADGKGQKVSNATLVVIDPNGPAWVAWPGRWGSSRARSALESDSPRGPAHQEKWRHPATFHAESDETRPRRGPAPAVPAPPAPEIVARREGDRAVIAFRFTPVSGQPTPVALVVSLDDPSDDLPPATHTEPIIAASGELEHPLPLEDGPYQVLVSAADDRGNMSEPYVSMLR